MLALLARSELDGCKRAHHILVLQTPLISFYSATSLLLAVNNKIKNRKVRLYKLLLMQVGFFEIVAMPLFKSYVELFAAAQPMLNAVKANYKYWHGIHEAHDE